MEQVKYTKKSEEGSFSDKNRKYRQYVKKLKRRAIKYFDRLVTLDLNIEEDQEEAILVAQKLRKRVDELCEQHLKDKGPKKKELQLQKLEIDVRSFKGYEGTDKKEKRLSQQKDELRWDDLQVTVQKVKDCQEEGIIGGSPTHLAMKSASSYLIGTYRKGFKVFEKDSQIYSGMLPKHDQDLLHATYAHPPINCYFLATIKNLYIKKINSKPASLFMNVRFTS